MTKHEFTAELERRLSALSPADREQSLAFYAEMIDDRCEEGMSEAEAVAAVGSPAEAADLIYKELPLMKLVKAKATPRRRLRAWEIVLLILGFPIWGFLLVALFSVLIAVYAAILSVVASLWAVNAALAGCALGGTVCFPISLTQSGFGSGLVVLGAAMLCAGLAVLLFYANIRTCKWLHRMNGKFWQRIKSYLFRKETLQ